MRLALRTIVMHLAPRTIATRLAQRDIACRLALRTIAMHLAPCTIAMRLAPRATTSVLWCLLTFHCKQGHDPQQLNNQIVSAYESLRAFQEY